MFKWRHQYDREADEREGDLAALKCEDESLTQQSFTEDADLNVIARRFGINAIPLGPVDPSHYRDTTNDPDLREVLEYQRQAKNAFMQLPAKLRMRFHNSPAELWHFVNDPENGDEAVRLGLLHDSTKPSAGAAPPAQQQSQSSPTPSSTGQGQGEPPPGTPPQGGVKKGDT